MQRAYLQQSSGSPATLLLILTAEFAVDLGSSLCWGKPTVLCLRPATDVCQLQTHRAEVQSCFLRVIQYSCFLQCFV